MDYHERKSIINMLSMIIVLGIYYWTVFERFNSQVMTTDEQLQFWSKAILIAIPLSIITKIVVMIVFAISNYLITREKMPSFEDERDKLIELKATRNSYIIFGIGFFISLTVLAFGYPPKYMFISIILGGIASEIFDNLSKVYYHSKGV
ncbi:DUF2178 domain-containing protein [Ekhidna sp.]|uniref:DUF2178 domain-containing protein n=1 Tax=Ekhidna sp. TaxID=2608089 RepID=UPI0032974DD8